MPDTSTALLKVSELFYSIQGESTYAGYPCVFIRLAGCNLRCSYCDARYTYDNSYFGMAVIDFEKETRDRKNELGQLEKRLLQKEDQLDRKNEQVEARAEEYAKKEREIADQAAGAGHPPPVGIVRRHEVAVGGAVEVELEGGRTVVEGLPKGGQGVFGQPRRGSTVAVQPQLVRGPGHASTMTLIQGATSGSEGGATSVTRPPVPASAPERRGEYEERASCGRAIFGDFWDDVPPHEVLET